MAPTRTVRVHEHTRSMIAEISRRRGVTAADLLDELVSRLEQDETLVAMNDAFARARADSGSWAAERAERAAWDHTLLDGLADL